MKRSRGSAAENQKSRIDFDTRPLTKQVRQRLGSPVAYYPLLGKICGSVKAGALLSQALYWTDKKPDGWFYKTASEWNEELGLSRSEQEGARRILRDLGLLKEEIRGMPARVYFFVDLEKLSETVSQFEKSPQATLQERRKQICGKRSNKENGNPSLRKPAPTVADNSQPFLIGTETTKKETTSKNTERVTNESTFHRLPVWLKRKVECELGTLSSALVGRNTFGWTPKDHAKAAEHSMLVACERAGVWGHVADELARERYTEVLSAELAQGDADTASESAHDHIVSKSYRDHGTQDANPATVGSAGVPFRNEMFLKHHNSPEMNSEQKSDR